MLISGSLVFSHISLPDLSSRIDVVPFFVIILSEGANPMNEYCASLRGPSIDSRRYAFSYFSWSLEKTCRGGTSKGIFLNLSVIFPLHEVAVGAVCRPKTIPHFFDSLSSANYTSALFKAYEYNNVHVTIFEK